MTVSIDGKALKYQAIEVAIFNSGNIDVWIMAVQTILDYPLNLLEMITGKPVNSATIMSK